MLRYRRRPLRSRVLAITLLISLIPSTSLVTAQDEDTYELPILSAICEREPTSFPFQGGDCEPTTNVVIVVTTMDGVLIGTCIPEPTRADDVIASCTVAVPWGATVIVTEDTTNVPIGYAPTNNPQDYDVPATTPDGLIGGPVFLNLPVSDATSNSEVDPGDVSNVPALVGEPEWWIVPFVEGYGNTEEGELYFGAFISNPSTETIEAGVSFRAYEADGTPFPGCQQTGGDGPGVTTSIAAGETAFLRCSRTIVPVALDDLQVTADLWVEGVVPDSPAPVEVIESEIVIDGEISSPMETSWDVTALARVTGGGDVETVIRFRFYDADGVQVGTCESDIVTIESGIDQRVTCWFPLLLDTQGPQPVTVRAEALAT